VPKPRDFLPSGNSKPLNRILCDAGWRRQTRHLLSNNAVEPGALQAGADVGAGFATQAAHQARLVKKPIDLPEVRNRSDVGAGSRPHLTLILSVGSFQVGNGGIAVREEHVGLLSSRPAREAI
jgi:hypothetical protein